jgi:hypothetical protein
MKTDNNLIQWLLEADNPSLRCRALKKLLDRTDNDPEVSEAKSAIPGYTPVRILLDRMHPDGYWLQKNPRTNEVFGDDVKYGAFGTTHYCLAYLAELGLDRSHPVVARASERYLSLQKPDGDWYRYFSCLLGYNVRTFTLLGYRDDPRVKRTINLLLRNDRDDGGYLCDIHEGRYKTKQAKSCVRGSTKVLLAMSELPEYWSHPRCKKLVHYFLQRQGIFRSSDHGTLVNKDMDQLSFPVTWRANVWEVLYALSRMGYGNDTGLLEAWKRLESKTDPEGKYILDWIPAQCPWKAGKRRTVSKWLTFYVLLAKKHREESSSKKRPLVYSQ